VTTLGIAGIANHEEYSLVRDLPDSEREKTLTLKRDKSIAKDQKKMDEMKKKLHTDDECMLPEYFVFPTHECRVVLADTHACSSYHYYYCY